MDKIQLFLSDGVTNMYSPEFGGNGGGPSQWTVPDGEHITQLEYRSGTKVDSISFITNKGTKSPHFGGYGGDTTFRHYLMDTVSWVSMADQDLK